MVPPNPIQIPNSPRGWPSIHCTLEDWQLMIAYVAACDVEINGFGYVDYDPIGHRLIMHHPFILKQEASMAGVETDAQALAEFNDWALREGYSLETMRLQWHSHVHMATVFSSTDTDNMKRWAGNMLVSLVLNKRGDYCCRLDVYDPILVSVELPVEIELPGPSVQMLREANRQVKELVKRPKFAPKPRQLPFPPKDGEPAHDGHPVDATAAPRRGFFSSMLELPEGQQTSGRRRPENVKPPQKLRWRDRV